MDWRTRINGSDRVGEEIRYMHTDKFSRRLRGAAWFYCGSDQGDMPLAGDLFCDIVCSRVPDDISTDFAGEVIIWLRKRLLAGVLWNRGTPVYSGMAGVSRFLELYWGLRRWVPADQRNIHLLEYDDLREVVGCAWRAADAANSRALARGRPNAVRDAARRDTEYIRGYPKSPPVPTGGDDRVGEGISEGEWDIVVPHSVDSARYWGGGTFWCTSAVGSRPNFFERYYNLEEGRVLFIFMNKRTGNVYQFEHWSRQFKDSGNNTCSDPILVQCLQDVLRRCLRHDRYFGGRVLSIQTWLWNGARRIVVDSRGLLHSDLGDGIIVPAVVTSRGGRCWYRNGSLHSWNDEPSFVQEDGSRFWHCDGALHRVGGPAIIWNNGLEEWWNNGVRSA